MVSPQHPKMRANKEAWTWAPWANALAVTSYTSMCDVIIHEDRYTIINNVKKHEMHIIFINILINRYLILKCTYTHYMSISCEYISKISKQIDIVGNVLDYECQLCLYHLCSYGSSLYWLKYLYHIKRACR